MVVGDGWDIDGRRIIGCKKIYLGRNGYIWFLFK